jgi:hypothetical protein
MIPDRDRICGAIVTRRLPAMGLRDKPTALSSPWQNGFAERIIGSIRRECLDDVVIGGEPHLRRVLKSHADYYNGVRTHRSSKKDAAVSRPVQRIAVISSRSILGELHHQYARSRFSMGSNWKVKVSSARSSWHRKRNHVRPHDSSSRPCRSGCPSSNRGG